METGFPKAYLHELEPSLLSSHEGEPKAIEELLYSSFISKLISVSADNIIRFWELREISHSQSVTLDNNNELITCECLDSQEELLVIGDESGNIRVLSFISYPKTQILYHFNAHRRGITTVQLFTTEETLVTLLLTTGVSRNVKIFTNKGYYLGYLGQNKLWNIKGSGIPARTPKYSQVFNRGGLPKSSMSARREKAAKEKINKYKNDDKTESTRYDSISSSVFRGIDIDKSKIEFIPATYEECYKMKTGRDIITSVPWAKKSL